MASTPEIGAAAPDFTLPGIILAGSEVEQRDFTLSAARGKPIVLAFYPGDETPVCTKQMCAYSKDYVNCQGVAEDRVSQACGLSGRRVRLSTDTSGP